MYKHYVRQKTLWIDTSYDKIGQYLDISPSTCVFPISASHWLPTWLSISEGGGRGLFTYLYIRYRFKSNRHTIQYHSYAPPHTHIHTRTTQLASNPAHASQWSDTRTTKLPRGQLPVRSRMAKWTCHDCRFLTSYWFTAFNLLFQLRVNFQRLALKMHIDLDEMPM